jgi:hypothetical protein
MENLGAVDGLQINKKVEVMVVPMGRITESHSWIILYIKKHMNLDI